MMTWTLCGILGYRDAAHGSAEDARDIIVGMPKDVLSPLPRVQFR
jgi:hypothetical protein